MSDGALFVYEKLLMSGLTGECALRPEGERYGVVVFGLLFTLDRKSHWDPAEITPVGPGRLAGGAHG